MHQRAARLARASVTETSTSNLTHASVDDYLREELQGLLHPGVVPEITSFYHKTASGEEAQLIEDLVDSLKLRGSFPYWKESKWLDAQWNPWCAVIMEQVRVKAIKYFWRKLKDIDTLERSKMISQSTEGNSTNTSARSLPSLPTAGLRDIVESHIKTLETRTWHASYRTPLTSASSDIRRRPDLLLTSTTSTPENWPTALILVEQKPSLSSAGCTPEQLALELAEYASETFGCQSFRQWVVSVAMVRDTMCCWRFDRCGGVSSQYITVMSNGQVNKAFVHAIIGLSLLTFEELGFYPIYDAPQFSPASNPPTVQFGYIKPQDRQEARDETKGTPDRPVFLHINGMWFQVLCRNFYRVSGVACRSTMCFVAQQVGSTHGKCLIKFSWRYIQLTPEGELFDAAHKGMPIAGLAQKITYAESTNVFENRLSCLGVPQPTLATPTLDLSKPKSPGITAEGNEEIVTYHTKSNRVLTITVLKDYGYPLWSAVTPLEMLKSIYDALVAHSDMYFTKRFLHRDPSTNNIIIRARVPETCRRGNTSDIATGDRAADDTIGFLIDLDYSVGEHRTDGQQTLNSGAPHRTGTVPFMAIPLLIDGTAPHKYVYDLQAFFFVTLWECLYPTRWGQKKSIVAIENPGTMVMSQEATKQLGAAVTRLAEGQSSAQQQPKGGPANTRATRTVTGTKVPKPPSFYKTATGRVKKQLGKQKASLVKSVLQSVSTSDHTTTETTSSCSLSTATTAMTTAPASSSSGSHSSFSQHPFTTNFNKQDPLINWRKGSFANVGSLKFTDIQQKWDDFMHAIRWEGREEREVLRTCLSDWRDLLFCYEHVNRAGKRVKGFEMDSWAGGSLAMERNAWEQVQAVVKGAVGKLKELEKAI